MYLLPVILAAFILIFDKLLDHTHVVLFIMESFIFMINGGRCDKIRRRICVSPLHIIRIQCYGIAPFWIIGMFRKMQTQPRESLNGFVFMASVAKMLNKPFGCIIVEKACERNVPVRYILLLAVHYLFSKLCGAVAVAAGLPTIAECGGFLYLHRTLQDPQGNSHPMAGALDGEGLCGQKLGRFGYVTLRARTGGLLCPEGETLAAHEFHYWESDGPGGDFHAQKPLSGRNWDCAYHTPTLYAGFPHLHFGGCPEAAARFVAACARYERGREG